MNAPKDGMPTESTYSIEAVGALDMHRTPIQKQPEMLLANYYLLIAEMDLFNLIRASNPTNVKIGSRTRAPHEVPLLTLTANRVIEMDDPAAATDSSGVPSTIERSPLDFAYEAGASDQGTAASEMPPSEDVPAIVAPGAGQAEEVAAADPPAAAESRKRGRDGIDVNAPPKVLRRDHADPQPTGSVHGGKNLAAIQLGLASTHPAPVLENAPAGVSDPDPLSFADPQSRHPADIAQYSQGTATAGDPDSENASSPPAVRSPKSENKVTVVLEIRTGGKAAEEIRCSGGSPGQEDSGPRARNKKPGGITGGRDEYEESRGRKECWAKPRIRTYACLVLGSSEFKRQQDDRVEQQCAEMEARLDALSIYFDEELYPHMLAAIACRQWAFADVVSAGIAKGLSEGLRHGLEHGQAQLSLESIEAYHPEAKAKFVAALQALKDLKYPLVDQLKGLKDAPIDVIMAALYLESDAGDNAPQYIRDLCPSSSQLTIPVYPEVRDPQNPWACKEEMVLADAIAANISRAEKKKKCRIVCRTHGVGSAHHAWSDGVPVSAPTVVPQGLAFLLADAAKQTEPENDT
uniref:Transposase (Putative), gypsy type n=1 Tax=Tanacetum cinerariifolium TaxID=118510 RepID=A0A6L2NQG8_TANCI|nr:hypothetical protein [Tanacetum cinerariifolium]